MTLARIGALSAFASAACALANLVTMALAVRFHVKRLHDFGSLVDVDDAGELLLVASMVVDAGFYAFLVPVALALTSSRWRFAGVAYGVIGAAGALTLAVAWPALFDRFDAGDVRSASEFSSITNFVYRVVWNLVCATVGALWWLTTSRALWSSRPWLARIALALGVVSAAKALAFFLPQHALALVLLDIYLALLPAFAVAAGASLLLRRVGS